MNTINQRLKPLENEHGTEYVLMPLVVPENVTDEKLERLQRNGRKVYRSGDTALVDEFV